MLSWLFLMNSLTMQWQNGRMADMVHGIAANLAPLLAAKPSNMAWQLLLLVLAGQDANACKTGVQSQLTTNLQRHCAPSKAPKTTSGRCIRCPPNENRCTIISATWSSPHVIHTLHKLHVFCRFAQLLVPSNATSHSKT